jgi:hypothetical protein
VWSSTRTNHFRRSHLSPAGRPAGERLTALDDSEIEAAREREFARLSEWITLRAKEIRDAREAHPESAPRREALLDEGLFDADSPEAERLKALGAAYELALQNH